MPDLLTPLTDLCQSQLEASRRITDVFFSGTGKIDRIVLDVTRRTLDEQFRYAQAVGNTRDLQVLANLQATFWSAKPEQLQQFQQAFMRIVAEVQNEFGRAAQAYVEQVGVSSLRAGPTTLGLAAASPGRRGSPDNPFAPLMSAWDSALQGASRLSGQAMATARHSARAASAEFNQVSEAFADTGASVGEAAANAAQPITNGSDRGPETRGDGSHEAIADDVDDALSHGPRRAARDQGNGHGNGQGLSAPAGQDTREEDETDHAGTESRTGRVRSHDASDDAAEPGDPATGGGRKSTQQRRK